MPSKIVRLSENFTEKEFACRCGCGGVRVKPLLLEKLQRARTLYGKPMRIMSGFRCAAHNAAVGGVKNSYHMLGLAADISYPNSSECWQIFQAFVAAGFTRIGIYRQGFIHVDVGETPDNVLWVE